ncbi:MAG: ChaN family lipoprotein [Bacteroidetes bacterium]|nr:ChaN family lipoprotein [Bacteroidota bacterium]MBU1374081.1 ChaN family lipoprotein [Bacteroidota bacterium]MBU1484579.1 ChaN family lipoprotein [Bacteroidota bacterium]MBU1760462.1 ChaN family lipoprotein [Bacteroidota bacterium]MBU2267684.1 ChaN family lipoprotein [Bacteroidota bacterium]
MRKKLFFLLFLIVTSLVGFSQNKPAYVIYNAKGKQVGYQKMIADLAKKDIILFGESHNNPISHWLEYEVTADLAKQKPMVLGAEMMEADNQEAVDKYLKGEIDEEQLPKEARLWPNYATDYAPLLNFAKENKLVFIATNIPRKYASLVFKNDFQALDSLSEKEKSWIAPLPIKFDPDLPTYQNISKMMGEHGSPLLVKAQAIKDATMAYFILKNYKDGSGFIHFNGSYHSDDYEGILWYLKQAKPDLKYGTISTVSQDDNSKLDKENLNKADYIICVDAKMTTTY